MIKRREFMRQGMLAGIAIGVAPLNAVTQSKAPDSPDYYSAFIPVLRPLGTNTPSDSEVTKGDELVLGSPKGRTPFDTMRYFSDITYTNSQGEAYNAGWSDRWNPVIVRFFECAGRTPSGDETFWCAASLNWVLARSGYVGTCSSSSSSFRCVGRATNDPQQGDIVVFREKDKQLADAGRGHVGLFVSKSATSITVLGGNQKKKGHHAVCLQVIDDRIPLVLDSFRSIDSLVKLADADQLCPCKPAINRDCPPRARQK